MSAFLSLFYFTSHGVNIWLHDFFYQTGHNFLVFVTSSSIPRYFSRCQWCFRLNLSLDLLLPFPSSLLHLASLLSLHTLCLSHGLKHHPHTYDSQFYISKPLAWAPGLSIFPFDITGLLNKHLKFQIFDFNSWYFLPDLPLPTVPCLTPIPPLFRIFLLFCTLHLIHHEILPLSDKSQIQQFFNPNYYHSTQTTLLHYKTTGRFSYLESLFCSCLPTVY